MPYHDLFKYHRKSGVTPTYDTYTSTSNTRYAWYREMAEEMLVEEMPDACGVCSGDVSRGTGRAKRLRLFGDSAAGTREWLDIFLYYEFDIRLEDTALVNKKWMCHRCINEIERYFKSIQEMNRRREQLLKKFSGVTLITTEQGSRKRANEEQSTSLTATPKRPKSDRPKMKVIVFTMQERFHIFIM